MPNKIYISQDYEKYTDSLLFIPENEDDVIAMYSNDIDGHNYVAKLTTGECEIEDRRTGVIYCNPKDFPTSLKQDIRAGRIYDGKEIDAEQPYNRWSINKSDGFVIIISKDGKQVLKMLATLVNDLSVYETSEIISTLSLAIENYIERTNNAVTIVLPENAVESTSSDNVYTVTSPTWDENNIFNIGYYASHSYLTNMLSASGLVYNVDTTRLTN